MQTASVLTLQIMLCSSVLAQAYCPGRHQFTVGLTSNYNYNHTRWGVSGYVKWLLPSHAFEGHRAVLTAKATHSPSTDGGHFFHGFDHGNYNNTSAIHLLGGYRFHFWDKRRFAGPSARPGRHAWYLEGSAGATYVGYDHSFGVAVPPLIGSSFSSTFHLTVGYHASYGKRDINLIELGVAFSF